MLLEQFFFSKSRLVFGRGTSFKETSKKSRKLYPYVGMAENLEVNPFTINQIYGHLTMH